MSVLSPWGMTKKDTYYGSASRWKNPDWLSKRAPEKPEPPKRFERAAMEFFRAAKTAYRRTVGSPPSQFRLPALITDADMNHK
jgi:hypothetical protein